uniref:hypothetical protein n=1 Tax=Candidatus Scatomorpha intestinigallinarum TaxID=2840923 RepID=UPI0040270DB0
MDIQTVGRDCVALNVHSRVSGAREAASLVRAALLLGGLDPWPRMELELFPSCGGTLIVARPSEGLAVEVADYALPFLRGN